MPLVMQDNQFGPHKIRASEIFASTELSFAFVNLKPVVPGMHIHSFSVHGVVMELGVLQLVCLRFACVASAMRDDRDMCHLSEVLLPGFRPCAGLQQAGRPKIHQTKAGGGCRHLVRCPNTSSE